MKENTDTLWESIYLAAFPISSKEQIKEAKLDAVIQWACSDETELSALYDKYVMTKRLRGIEPNQEN